MTQRLAAPPPSQGPVNGGGSTYAGLATRLVAFGLDAAIINAVAWSVGLVVALALSLFHLPDTVITILAALGAAAAIAWSVAYFTFFWSTTGQTPGNRVLSIEVRTGAGERLRARRALLRVLALPLSVLPLGAGVALILFDRQRRALHDRLVRTVVVYAVEAQLASTSLPPSSATRRPKRISAG